jgi:hypothetical protein
MSDCCDIHSGVKPATLRVILYEPGRKLQRYDVCDECGEAMYNHDAGKLRQAGRPGQVEGLERTVANPDTIVRLSRIHDAPDRAAEAGIGGRSASEADPRSQLRAAVEAGKQAKLEKAVEHVAARQHQAAPGPGNEQSATELRDPDLGQGPLTREDRLSKKDIAELAVKTGTLGIAAAHGMNVPHMGLPDEISDAIERSSVNEYLFSGLNAEVTVLRVKEKANEAIGKAGETAGRFRNRVENARYPAQRDEQGFGRDLR